MQGEFVKAYEANDIKRVMKLLVHPLVDPSVGRNCAIRHVCSAGFIEIARLLLADPRVDPSDCYNFAIRWACEGGHLEIVRLLLADPRVDPSFGLNDPLFWASRNGYFKIVGLLLQDSRVTSKNLTMAIKEAATPEIKDLLVHASYQLDTLLYQSTIQK